MAVDKENYAHLIRRLVPVNELPPQIQNEAIKKCNILSVRKGSFIFKQGDRDDYSYYLLEGEIELYDQKHLNSVISVGTDRARYAMAQLQPRQFSAKAKIASIVMQISRDALDKLMVLQENGQNDVNGVLSEMEVEEVNLSDLEGEELDWMTKILQSELFSRIPTANIHQMFALLEPLEFKAGDIVIKQGDVGEHYYIIQEGSCQVSRKANSGGKEINLAVLSAGDSFGEEALISESTRNATVSMLTDGVLMQLSKDNFIELIKKPTVQSLTYSEASILVAAGAAQWLDVRFKDEYESSAIKGSRNIPLNILRTQFNELQQDKQYILYCDTGGRSSTGAFLMTNYGFDVSYLEGGLLRNPDAVSKKGDTRIAGKAEQIEIQSRTQLKSTPKRSKKGPYSFAEDITRENLDPEIKASLLEAELARTDMRMEEVEKIKQKHAEKSEKEMQEEVQRKIAEERAQIEAAKKAAEQEARKLREKEELKIKKMQEEAAKRMEDEKKKLEEVYNRNAEEMEKLQRMRNEAQEQLRKERERLDKEAKNIKSDAKEASRIKKEIEDSKRRLEEQALKKQKATEALEREIQEKARETLEAERRKMAEEFARSQEDIEKAKREQAAALAAREAAKAEAEKIIAEFKIKHAEERAADEAKLKAERLKLEEQQRKIKLAFDKIQSVKKEAETAKQKAMDDAKRLRAKKNNKEITHSRFVRKKLDDDIKAAEARINRANKDIYDVQQAQKKAEAAKKSTEEGLNMKKALEKQLSTDLEEFRKEEKKKESFPNLTSQMEHMKRIREKAEIAKKESERANQNLFSDIKSLLKKNKD